MLDPDHRCARCDDHPEFEYPADPSALAAVYAQITEQIEREDSLGDRRTIWLLTFEGLVFTAYGLLIGRAFDTQHGTELTSTIIIYVAAMLMAFGAVVAHFVMRTVHEGCRQLAYLKCMYERSFELRAQFVRPYLDEGEAYARLPENIAKAFVSFCGVLSVATILLAAFLTVEL